MSILSTWIVERGPAGSTRRRSVEFTANEITRGDWPAAFWALFPTDEAAFADHVRVLGIHVFVTLEFEPATVIQPEYGGVPSRDLLRLLPANWDSVDLEQLLGDLTLPIDRDSIDRFMRDLDNWRREYRTAVARAKNSLPDPPGSFVWASTRGGPVRTRDAGGLPVARRLAFRLWRRDLGYMPLAE